jgi:NAD(P)-dependent dehydrogenase (short-subunit alcohol dehydrogenase family)
MKRTVLITGGSKGIGFATAKRCLENDCRVILVAREQESLEGARDRLVAAGHSAEVIAVAVADMREPEAIPELIRRLPWIDEGLWGLVPNAALEILKRVEDFSTTELLDSLKVNVVSPICLIRECYCALKNARGNVVYVGSVADFKREARYSVYGGSKAFMKSFVGHAGQELGFNGIRINVVSPGATETELLRHMRDVEKAWPEEQIRTFLQSIPIEQRNGTPEEMADAIWFALSGPRYFHGEDIRIYGGHP